MNYKTTPITARILKTTKGGITQPILNMGAAVTKMKAPSVAKQTSGKLKPGEGVLKTPPKSTAVISNRLILKIVTLYLSLLDKIIK